MSNRPRGASRSRRSSRSGASQSLGRIGIEVTISAQDFATYVKRIYADRAFDLHERCDSGDRHACVRFGILIGQHREHVAAWRRSHPDYFSYED